MAKRNSKNRQSTSWVDSFRNSSFVKGIALSLTIIVGITTFLNWFYGEKIESNKEQCEQEIKLLNIKCQSEINAKMIEVRLEAQEKLFYHIIESTKEGDLIQETFKIIEKRNEKK